MAWFLVGLLVGLVPGFVAGFVAGCYGSTLVQKKWVRERKIKLGDKVYRLEEDD